MCILRWVIPRTISCPVLSGQNISCGTVLAKNILEHAYKHKPECRKELHTKSTEKKYFITYPISNQEAFQMQTFQDEFPKRGQESYTDNFQNYSLFATPPRNWKKKMMNVTREQKKCVSKMTRTAFNP